MSTRDHTLQAGACAALEIAAKRRGLLGLEQCWARFTPKQRQLVSAAFLDELRREAAKELHMTTSVTPMPTASDARREAERIAKARASASDTAAHAVAELCRQLRGNLYLAIAGSRFGLVEEEIMQAFDAGELTRTILAALVADGEVEHRQGVYSIPRTAA